MPNSVLSQIMQSAIWADSPRACSQCCKSNDSRHDHRRGPRTWRAPPGDRRKRRCRSGVSSDRTRTVVSSTVPVVTEPAPVPPKTRQPPSPGVGPAAIGPRDAPPHAAAFCSAGTSSSTRRPRSSSPPPSRPRSKSARLPGRRAGADVFPPIASRCSENGSCPVPGRRGAVAR